MPVNRGGVFKKKKNSAVEEETRKTGLGRSGGVVAHVQDLKINM